MKRLILFTAVWPVLALASTVGLSGCAATKIKPEENVVIVKEIEKKIPLNIAYPEPLNLDHPEWIIVTEENIDEVWKEIREDNEGVALFALRHGDYEKLGMNIVEIRKLIGEYIVILKQYKNYYESDNEEK